MIFKRSAPTTGLDLFGFTRVAVTAKAEPKGVTILDAWELPLAVGAHVGGALFDAPGAVDARVFLRQPADPEALVVGVEDVPGSLQYKPTAFKSAVDLLRAQADFTTPRGGRADFGFDIPVTHMVPLPRRHDNNTWAALTFDVRAPGLMQAVDRIQGEVPAARPRLDARFLAPLRAFLTLGDAGADETLLFSHLDLYDSLHVLVHRQSPVVQLRYQQGLAHIAAESASVNGQPFAEAIERLYGEGFDDAGAVAYAKLMNMVVEQVRQRLASGFAQPQRGAEGVRLQRLVLSGPLTDHASLLATRIKAAGATPVQQFRPLADCKAPAEAQRRAGRYTVALGHALNPASVAADHLLLPVDLTFRLSLDQLARERRLPTSIIQSKTVRQVDRRGPSKAALRLSRYSKAAPVLYVVPFAMIAKLGWTRWEGRQLERQVAEARDAYATTSAQVTALENARAERAALAKRQRALGVLAATRAWPSNLLHATEVAMGRASDDVWLTEFNVTPDGDVQFSGVALSYPALASYLDALRADTTFASVAFQRATAAERGIQFAVKAKVGGVPQAPDTTAVAADPLAVLPVSPGAPVPPVPSPSPPGAARPTALALPPR